jgi:isoprenylcysteine carboxyl methyltransferase (ICMT) family protein YpbQ
VAELKFPALYIDADTASGNAQKEYLRLIKIEYLLLIFAAILTMQPFNGTSFLIGYALVFILSLIVMLIRTLQKPDQDWYKCRALAESIKTSTWRYAMRAEPFDDARTQDARADFRKLLKAIFESNQHIGNRISGLRPDGKQLTPEMDDFRDKPLDERKTLYLTKRIKNQRLWYTNKAKFNKKAMNSWIIICSLIYLSATALVLISIKFPEYTAPTGPIIVLASSIVGWMQIKKFSELSSSYSLTAHEIGFIEERANDAKTDEAFSMFVNEAELAFSREHTQWVARQLQA